MRLKVKLDTEGFIQAMQDGKLHEKLEEMRRSDTLRKSLPEVDKMIGAEQPEHNHEEGDVYQHTLLALKFAPPTIEGQLSALLHDAGKIWGRGSFPGKGWYSGHDIWGVPLAKRVMDRFEFDETVKDRVLRLVRFHHVVHFLRRLPDNETMERIFLEVGHDLIDSLLILGRADELGHIPQLDYVPAIRRHVKKYLELRKR